jgi:hypothetical protein
MQAGKGAAKQPLKIVRDLTAQAAAWVVFDELLPWKKNPKEHDIKDAASSLRRFGFGAPCVAWSKKKMLVVGHGRLKGLGLVLKDDPKLAKKENAILRASLQGQSIRHVPVRFMNFKNEREAEAYALRDNNPFGQYDPSKLSDVLKELNGGGVDLSGLGFSTEQTMKLLAESPIVLPGSAPDTSSTTNDALKGKIGANGGPQVRVVQLVYSPTEHDQFVKCVKALSQNGKLGAAKIVLEALTSVAMRS